MQTKIEIEGACRMNVRHVVLYTFSVSAMELKEILSALKASPHPDAQNLSLELQKQVDKSRAEIQRRFQAQHTVICRDDDPEGRSP
jgi:selenocysteine lyase/cysteine desulfurase